MYCVVYQESPLQIAKNATHLEIIPQQKHERPTTLPLNNSFDSRLVCIDCLLKGFTPAPTDHPCRMDTLVTRKGPKGPWSRIRLRTYHRNFRGQYKMCVKSGCSKTSYRNNYCTFAHSEAERILWTMEKTGVFDIQKYIRTNRTSAIPLFSTKNDIFAVYPVNNFLLLECKSWT